ncbi:MAG: hypothetical protein ACLUFV_00460 [Acutalibacteraceae bacterium]
MHRVAELVVGQRGNLQQTAVVIKRARNARGVPPVVCDCALLRRRGW